MDRIYLIPGFFGFAQIGDLHYFRHVERILDEHFSRAGRELELHAVDTVPTAQLGARAARLLDQIQATANAGDRIHLIGHSTGGLDARYLASGAPLAEERPHGMPSPITTVTCLATPNRGTPTARLFQTLRGQRAMRVFAALSLHAVGRGRRLPLGTLKKVVGLGLKANDAVGGPRSLADELFDNLLQEFTPERREAVHDFMLQVGEDQGLLSQLTPAAMESLELPDAPWVRYAYVATRAPRPSLRGKFDAGVRPYAQLGASIYQACWGAASSSAPERYPPLILEHPYPEPIDHRDNDAMVPTLSQPHGRLLRVATADHLDVLGHFSDRSLDPPHYDWLPSGAGFTRKRFEALWTDVSTFILDDHRGSI